jgi:EAL domain-containing protein (putative c-di-GMP-specific phosphodiesterase class I)
MKKDHAARQGNSSERALLLELQAIKQDPLGKRVVHFAVSLAPAGEDLPRKLDGAIRFLQKSFEKAPYFRIFAIGNGDLFAAYANVSLADVVGICGKVEKLFMGDGALTVRNAYDEYGFFKILEAAREIDRVIAAVQTRAPREPAESETVGKTPMTPENLAFLVDKLRHADVRDCISSQPVHVIGQTAGTVEFVEFFLSTQAIEQSFLPGVSVAANPWLFHALRAELDRAALRAVLREVKAGNHPAFSLNLGVSTILSPVFSEFLARMPADLAARIILEVHKTDLVQNGARIRDLTALVAERGLRLCIDGLNWKDFEFLAIDRIAPQYAKIIWSDELLSAGPADLAPFAQSLKAFAPRTAAILSHCDNPRAFPLIHALGIPLVQGYLADQFCQSGLGL